MQRFLLLVTAICTSFFSLAQDNDDARDSIGARIVDEGKQLYRSEMASWYGTDVFLEKFKDKDKMGGYFSYTEGREAKCIFFSKGANPKVIGTIIFDDTYNTATAKSILKERDFTSTEKDLFHIRATASKIIDSDTLFKVYNNTGLNLIPFIYKGQRKAYVLTAPKENGVIIFGNDYELTFGEQNQLTGKKQLHRNIIMTEYGKNQAETEFGSMHSHLPETGDFITPTDICTLMLYEKFAKWQQHIVISANYVSIWDCNKNQLITLTTEAWNKIIKDQQQKQQ
jgi:hypothetical protein